MRFWMGFTPETSKCRYPGPVFRPHRQSTRKRRRGVSSSPIAASGALKKSGSEPFAREQQQFRWLEADELAAVAWLETDREFVDFLMLAEKKRR